MEYKKYFQKYGKIYGVRSKYDFGKWEHVGYIFSNLEDAEEWLHREEYNFYEKELMSKTAAKKLCGNNFWEE